MRRILVTGAGGAFGPSIISHFSSRPDFAVYGTDVQCPHDEVYRPCDMQNPREVDALLGDIRPDTILHLVGTTSADYSDAFAVNVEVARILLEAVERNHKGTRVVLTGSAAEYGVVAPEENPVSETHPLAPVSVYGVTKAWQTMLMHLFVHRGVDVVVARPFNLDGPGLSDRLFVGRVQRQIAALTSGRTRTIKIGPLAAVRDYIRFGEAALQYEAITRGGDAGQVYHVASGVPVSMRDVLAGYLERNGLDFSCVEEDPIHLQRAGYDVPVIYADVTRTKQLLAGMDVASRQFPGDPSGS